MLRTGSLEDAATAKKELEELVKAAARPETNRLYRTFCRWWKEIEVLIFTGATTGKVEANNTATKKYQAHRPWLSQPRQLQIGYSLEKCCPGGGMTPIPGIYFPTNREEPSNITASPPQLPRPAEQYQPIIPRDQQIQDPDKHSNTTNS
ncbi:transposase [Arthrobacter bambusae]|uniref:transposase n=1 Tax=Arthrobacter TaxID=1663 RepID=UPI001F508D05|nr:MULTISPECIES: transposase [Arthrobacter]MCI0139984.1 transposase [Arthrobacter bambusae]